MPYVKVGEENGTPVELYFEDAGDGAPVVLIHGWPLSGQSWEKQATALLDAGHRVITYDRRGFGKSSQPASGYDYDTMASDLDALLSARGVKDAALVGFSMGGGEVARYLGKFGSSRVSKAVFISAIPPYLRKTDDNAEGVDPQVFEGIKQALSKDRFAFLSKFFSDFYNVDELGGTRVSEEAVRWSWAVAAMASARGTLACVDAWLTDFRADLQAIDVPTLVIHGDVDRIVPFAASGKRVQAMIAGSRLKVIEGGPHGVLLTHADEVTQELRSFLAAPGIKRAGATREAGLEI